MPGLIDAYLADFDRELAFDRRLARRVHQEVETHLHDAMDDAATEAEAIGRFGNPQSLAQQYVAASLPYRVQKAWILALVLAATTFAFMRLRSVWLGLPEIDNGPLAALTTIDRAGFIAGLILGLYGWHVSRRSARKAISPLLGAAVAFSLSILASLIRATILSGGDPLIWLTGGAEVLMIAAAVMQLRLLQRYAAFTAR